MLAAEQRQKRLKRLQSGRSVLGATQAWRAGGAPAPAGAEAAELAGGEGEDAMASFLVQDDAPAGHVPARPFEASDEEEAGGGAAGCLAARARAPSGTPPGAAADELAPVRPAVQVIYCSRTHSQLAQFVGEVRRTKFAASLSTVSLGARKQLCAHAPVARLGSAARVNDGCQALQRSKGAGCPKLHPRTAPAQAALRDRLLTAPLEVEELHALGSALGCWCGARARTPRALPRAAGPDRIPARRSSPLTATHPCPAICPPVPAPAPTTRRALRPRARTFCWSPTRACCTSRRARRSASG